MKKLKPFIKIIFSFAIIAYLFWRRVDFNGIMEALSAAHINWILLALMLHPLGIMISSYRWQILLKAQSVEVPIKKLFVSYLVCGFFNQFLPTRVGGDLIRAYDTRIFAHSGVKSFAIVFVERVSGMSMLFIFTLVLSGIRLFQGPSDLTKPIYIAGIAIGLSGLLAIAMICHSLPLKIAGILLNRVKLGKFFVKLEHFHQTIVSYWEVGKRRQFLNAFLLAFCLQINVIIYYFLLGKAFGLDRIFQIYEYFVIVPLVQVILMIPIGLNGIGLREASWIGFLKQFGISWNISFAFSVVDFMLYLIIGIIGGIVYALRR